MDDLIVELTAEQLLKDSKEKKGKDKGMSLTERRREMENKLKSTLKKEKDAQRKKEREDKRAKIMESFNGTGQEAHIQKKKDTECQPEFGKRKLKKMKIESDILAQIPTDQRSLKTLNLTDTEKWSQQMNSVFGIDSTPETENKEMNNELIFEQSIIHTLSLAEDTNSSLASFPKAFSQYFKVRGFTIPTPIQNLTWSHILNGKDLLGIAQAGSGKTLAYLLPAIPKLQKKKSEEKRQTAKDKDEIEIRPKSLFLLPTRELALQVHEDCKYLKRLFGFDSFCLLGGFSKKQQLSELKDFPQLDILISTPGRLIDFLQENFEIELSLSETSYIVIDEADKMLNKGFIEQLKVIQRQCSNPHRQVVLYSATFPPQVNEMCKGWMKSPIKVEVNHPHTNQACEDFSNSRGTRITISHSIIQEVHMTGPEHKKRAKLMKFLMSIKEPKQPPLTELSDQRVLIFVNTIKTGKELSSYLTSKKLSVGLIFGEKKQQDRIKLLEDFKSRKLQILIATDVAARGIHIENLCIVINYDFPVNLETYAHRIGRTGRNDKLGYAYSFFTKELTKMAPDLLKLLNSNPKSIVNPQFKSLAEGKQIK